MGLWDKLFNRSITKANTTVPGNYTDAFFTATAGGRVVTNPTATGHSVRVYGFEKNPVVHSCVQTISNLAGSVPFEVYSLGRDGEVSVIYDSPLNEVLVRPNTIQSSIEFRKLTFAHLLVYGNAYWWIRRNDSGRPERLELVHPESSMTVYRDPATGEVKLYHFFDRSGNRQQVSVNDIVHFKDLTLEDWVFGFPRMASALSELMTDNEANDYVRQILANDGRPGIVISGPNMTPDDLKAAEEAWNQKMQSRGHRGKTVFAGGDLKLQVIGFDLQQLEFLDLRKVAREGICSVFGVDPRMVGIGTAGSDAGLSGVQYFEARARLIQHTVLPLMQLMEETINHWFTVEYGNYYVRFSPDDIAKYLESPESISMRIGREFQQGIRGRKEARRAVGLPDDLPSDDELFTAPNTLLPPMA